jgi:hypothetical protein
MLEVQAKVAYGDDKVKTFALPLLNKPAQALRHTESLPLNQSKFNLYKTEFYSRHFF